MQPTTTLGELFAHLLGLDTAGALQRIDLEQDQRSGTETVNIDTLLSRYLPPSTAIALEGLEVIDTKEGGM